MIIICLIFGIVIACLLWSLVRLTFGLLVSGIALFCLFMLLVPGALLLLGGIGFTAFAMLCTLGVLFLISLYQSD